MKLNQTALIVSLPARVIGWRNKPRRHELSARPHCSTRKDVFSFGTVARAIACILTLSCTAWGGQYLDPAGDTSGPDLVRLDAQITGTNLDLKLTFVQELEGSLIDPAVSAHIYLDADRSLMTGFRPGPGFHARFGVDYEIEVFLGGFGPTSNSAELRYWRRIASSLPPFVELDRVQVALGDWWDPNGSVFVVGADATYGTDHHQVFLRVPLNLFTNVSFPICGEGQTCIGQVFPCPLPVVRNIPTAYVSVFAMDPYDINTSSDSLPDHGMIDPLSGLTVSEFPAGTNDLAAATTDPDNDGWAQPGINGEELTGFKAYRHDGNALAFELQLLSYTIDDTAIYYVALDLDDNPATGEPWTNGAVALGLDLVAQFANFDNPVGWANPLEGTIHFRLGGQWCPLVYADYLANVWRSKPGYVFITVPAEFTARELAANATGLVRAVALAAEPSTGFFNDVAPNNGALAIRVTTPTPPRISGLVRRPDRSCALEFTWSGPANANLGVAAATELGGPWNPVSPVAITPLGGGRYEAVFAPPPSQARGFYRIAINTNP